MNVLLINGSPKKQGNTGSALKLVADELSVLGHNANLQHIIDYNIHGCNGCFGCQKNNEFPGCVIDDDHHKIRDLILESDAVLLGSPLYMWGFTAQLKALLDRNICLVNRYGYPEHESLVEGKPFAFLLTCGGPVKDNAEETLTAFDRITGHIKAKNLGAFTIQGCSPMGELPLWAGEVAKEAAEKIASVG